MLEKYVRQECPRSALLHGGYPTGRIGLAKGTRSGNQKAYRSGPSLRPTRSLTGYFPQAGL